MVVQMMAVGEDTGALDTMLDKIAEFYDQEVEATTEALTALIEPLMIAFLGAHRRRHDHRAVHADLQGLRPDPVVATVSTARHRVGGRRRPAFGGALRESATLRALTRPETRRSRKCSRPVASAPILTVIEPDPNSGRLSVRSKGSADARSHPQVQEEKDQGFTLIELLVVMIIIGILAAIAIPVFLTSARRPGTRAAKSDVRNAIGKEIATYFVDGTGTLPDRRPSSPAPTPSSSPTASPSRPSTGGGTTTGYCLQAAHSKLASADLRAEQHQRQGDQGHHLLTQLRPRSWAGPNRARPSCCTFVAPSPVHVPARTRCSSVPAAQGDRPDADVPRVTAAPTKRAARSQRSKGNEMLARIRKIQQENEQRLHPDRAAGGRRDHRHPDRDRDPDCTRTTAREPPTAAQSDLRNAINVLEHCKTDNSTYPTRRRCSHRHGALGSTCAGLTVTVSANSTLRYVVTVHRVLHHVRHEQRWRADLLLRQHHRRLGQACVRPPMGSATC